MAWLLTLPFSGNSSESYSSGSPSFASYLLVSGIAASLEDSYHLDQALIFGSAYQELHSFIDLNPLQAL